MWHEINSRQELEDFLHTMGYFHDSCIKEMQYTSGAYVQPDLSMYPINSLNVLRVIIQRQFPEHSMIEMEFGGLKRLQLCPHSPAYTSEILGATMLWRDGDIFWLDDDNVSETEAGRYTGTLICAQTLRWRSVAGRMGAEAFYTSLA